jgi:uncharacterized protein
VKKDTALMGRIRRRGRVEMLSKYNIFLEDYKILFNTLTGYIIKLNDNELEKLERGIVPEELKDIIEEGFSATFDEFIHTFTKNVFEPTLVLTYRCNFDCVYCFQKAFRDNSSVSDKVVNCFIKYIRNHENGRKVRVTFFGGEPLLEIQRIKEISMKLSDLKYSFSVVTNGSLLTKHIVNELKSLGLSHVQVTLDGPREVHDKRRYFVGGRGSYDIILKNLRDIQDDVNIVLRVNIDVNNITSFRELLRDLKQNGITKVRLDPHLVHENVFRNEYWDYILPKDKEGEILVKVWEIAKEEGFGIPQDVFRLGKKISINVKKDFSHQRGNPTECCLLKIYTHLVIFNPHLSGVVVPILSIKTLRLSETISKGLFKIVVPN